MTSLLLGLAILQTPPAPATRYDMGERLKAVDVAWMEASIEQKAAAVGSLSGAVGAFFTGGFAQACQQLDRSWFALTDTEYLPESAVTVRFSPAVVDRDSEAVLRITWAYRTGDAAVKVSLAGRSVDLLPGETAELRVPVTALHPEFLREVDAGVAVPVQVGSLQRTAYISMVKNWKRRSEEIGRSEDPWVQHLISCFEEVMDGTAEQDTVALDALSLAEKVMRNDRSLLGGAHVPRAQSGRTVLRAVFPPGYQAGDPVVIAVHGAGGSENLFIDGYGNGIAVRLASDRGWGFVSPRLTQSAVQDSLDWVKDVFDEKPSAVYLMGHSAGGAVLTATPQTDPPATAVAYFAPAGNRVPAWQERLPLFLAVGEQEMAMLVNGFNRMAEQVQPFESASVRRYPFTEHLMIVAESMRDAYRIFDQASWDDRR